MTTKLILWTQMASTAYALVLLTNQIREQRPVLRELMDAGKIGLTGSLYDLPSGRVVFLQN